MQFDDDDLWDECTSDSNDYKGVDFSTDVSLPIITILYDDYQD